MVIFRYVTAIRDHFQVLYRYRSGIIVKMHIFCFYVEYMRVVLFVLFERIFEYKALPFLSTGLDRFCKSNTSLSKRGVVMFVSP